MPLKNIIRERLEIVIAVENWVVYIVCLARLTYFLELINEFSSFSTFILRTTFALDLVYIFIFRSDVMVQFFNLNIWINNKN